MKYQRIITIAGRPGSGKSSASKGVAARLGYQHFSSGDLMRAIGKEHGIDDIHQVNLSIEKESTLNFDELVDQRLRDIGKSDDQIVIDSRMAWHWMPTSFKVYLDLDLDIAARRIIGQMDEQRMAHEHVPANPAEYASILQSRLASEARRYQSLYNVNPFTLSHYDLVIDTNSHDKQSTIDKIIDGFEAHLGHLGSSTH